MRRKARLTTICVWIILLVIWFIVTNLKLISPILFPSPQDVWLTFTNILIHGYNNIPFWEHLGITLFRLFSALILAIITAVPLGLASGMFEWVHAVIDSVIQFYRPIPPLAYYTILILWLGIGESSKIILLYLAAFAPIYIACVEGVHHLNRDYILSAKSLGARKWSVFKWIIFPGTLPDIFTGIRTAMGVSFSTLVAAEMVASTSGIGWMVIDASKYLKSSVMFLGIFILGGLGLFLDWILQLLEGKLIFWKGKE
ncbi:ABC transporter permease subunit [Companilactobacillus alimentarius]|uniref:Taurine ABC transporter permease n=1 Tax=Companilactobacillus alimentarius DSM 20249 TaxID=1423720 RepID=A0A2K9HPE8_9LACO|nr:ABC transporter permease [Companilactobacillus alimentarius]AUI71222.1 taurine ABC transporter permease [Companilactobacillus alimentarius DSM 20249]KRK75357.1 taurine transport system permease protein tauC [Companilactobacillus alimentarius DSM 20249]MDT6951499.1 ABC transporter permease [Companilactobacillus alimentarius]GEO43860.1 taurine ABC transporter permease [Companilactobacillus alimentarius]